MSTDKKKQYETFVTPRGVASWPHLNSPDTKFNKDGTWHTKLVFDPNKPEDAAFLAGLEERRDAYIEGLKLTLDKKQLKALTVNSIVSDELDQEGDETGMKVVSFKMYATGTGKNGEVTKREPRFFDAKGKKITLAQLPKLAGGSILKIEYAISEYHKPKGSGITLYLNNVQVIKAVEYTGAGSSKFGDEGDGFAAPEVEETTSAFEGGVSETPAGETDGDF